MVQQQQQLQQSEERKQLLDCLMLRINLLEGNSSAWEQEAEQTTSSQGNKKVENNVTT